MLRASAGLEQPVHVRPTSGDENERSSATKAKSRAAETACSRGMFKSRLVSSVACLGSSAMRLAQASASESTSSSATTWLAKPISAARRGRYPGSGEGVLLGELEADQKRPGHRCAVGRDQTDQEVGIGEVRALGHVDDVGQRDDAATESDRRAVHRSDDRMAAGHHPPHDPAPVLDGLPPERGVLRQLVEVLEITSRGKGAAVTGYDHCSGIRVGVELGECIGDRPVQRVVRRIQVVGPVQTDDSY